MSIRADLGVRTERHITHGNDTKAAERSGLAASRHKTATSPRALSSPQSPNLFRGETFASLSTTANLLGPKSFPSLVRLRKTR